MRLTPPTLRRRNIARLKEHRRWLIERGDDENDSASGSESEGEEDSDDETSVPPVRATSIARPSITSTLRVSAAPPTATSALTTSVSRPSAIPASTVGSGLVLASQTTIKASLPTAGLGSTLLVGEAEGLPEEEPDSDPDGLSSDDGDDSDDETTTGTGVATSTTTPAATLSSSLSRTVPTLTAIPHTSETSVTSSSGSSSRGAGQTVPPKVTSTPSATRSTAPLSTLLVPASQVDPKPISSTIGAPVQETTAGKVLGPEIDVGEKTTMNGGAVAGVVFGVLAGVSILAVVGFLLLKRLRGRGYDLSSLNPFSRNPSDSDGPARPMTTGTTWTWNRKLWGAASSGPRTTVASVPPPLPLPKSNPKTNSEMIDDLVQASYAAENGTPPDHTHTHNHNRQSDLESQSVTHWPPSPGSFINEKAYNALEGPWPPYAPPTPAKLKRSSKPPAVTRWLDGILTPRQSVTPQTIPLPQGTMQGTKWQESVLQGLAPPPVPGFAKGQNSNPRNTTVTETTETTSSVVW